MYDYTLIIERLKHHRQRLGLSREQCKEQIRQRYNKTFHQLTDDEIIDYGQFLANMNPKK